MSLKSAPFYWLVCDRCGASNTEGGDLTAWSEAEHAVAEAEDSEWWVEGGNHVCYDCAPLDRDDEDQEPTP